MCLGPVNCARWFLADVLEKAMKKNTNVIELYNLILKEVDDNQKTWYNSGIGTYARPSWKSLRFYKQVLFHKIDLAIAWYVEWSLSISRSESHFFTSCLLRDSERTVFGAYRWLSENYKPDDCIFLFGALNNM